VLVLGPLVEAVCIAAFPRILVEVECPLSIGF
jgi:hypothetical protein